MVRGVGADRQRQAVAIHDRHDFHAFSTLGRSDLGASALRHHEGCVDEAFFFVEHAAFAQFVIGGAIYWIVRRRKKGNLISYTS